MRDEHAHEWTADPETEAEATVYEQPAAAVPTAGAEPPVVAPATEPATPPGRPAARYADRERLEDDPDKPYFVTDWKGLRNYHCRPCAEAGKHFASTRLERTMEHFAERHLPQTVDLGLVTPSGRPLRIRR